MKILFLLSAIFATWHFTDLDSDSALFCFVAPLFLSVFIVLGVAEFIREFELAFGGEDGPGDGGGFD